MNTKVKVCGITSSEDALAAAHEGAAAIGFIFVQNSARYLQPQRARQIIRSLPPFVTPVGVVTRTSRLEALALVAESGIRCLQLHEDCDPNEFTDFPIPCYRVFRVGPDFNVEQLPDIGGGAFMLDTYVDGLAGGTGKTFDWTIAVKAKQFGSLILSGGINPHNVGDAIRRVSPYAIDVNSGVEQSPGVKDHAKLRSFFRAIEEAEDNDESRKVVVR